MRPEARAPAAKTGKQPKGPKGYREVGCGRLSLYDAAGERLDTVRYARQTEQHKATLRQQLEAEAQAVGAMAPGPRLVKHSDGARAHWDYLARLTVASAGCPLAGGGQCSLANPRMKATTSSISGQPSDLAISAYSRSGWVRMNQAGAFVEGGDLSPTNSGRPAPSAGVDK